MYRPVPAIKLYGSTYRVQGIEVYDPDDEEWEFLPEEVVRVEKKELEGELVFVAVEKYDKTFVELTIEETIVLFDWLTRFNKGNHKLLFKDQAEQRVLWDLESSLEKVTNVTFDSNYSEILKQAREKVRDREG